jgi:thiosulfate dehydrogenase [quinone] large subunit
MADQNLETEIFGKKVDFDYADHWVGYSLLAMRIGMGWILLQGGLTKLVNPSWTAAGYLTNVPAGNPFMNYWSLMAGNPIVDQLVIWGLILTGLGLIVGAFTRLTVFSASTMMMLFWASSLEGGLLQGFPVAHGWLVDSHIVYVILMVAAAEFGAGRILGVDRYLENTELVKNNSWLKHFLA